MEIDDDDDSSFEILTYIKEDDCFKTDSKNENFNPEKISDMNNNEVASKNCEPNCPNVHEGQMDDIISIIEDLNVAKVKNVGISDSHFTPNSSHTNFKNKADFISDSETTYMNDQQGRKTHRTVDVAENSKASNYIESVTLISDKHPSIVDVSTANNSSPAKRTSKLQLQTTQDNMPCNTISERKKSDAVCRVYDTPRISKRLEPPYYLRSSSSNKKMILPKQIGERNSAFIERNSIRSVCSPMNLNLNICNWFKRNKYIQSFIEQAKASTKHLCSAIGTELYGITKTNEMELIIIAEDSNFLPIQNAFLEVFNRSLITTAIEATFDFLPVLPVGFSAAVSSARMKIEFSREHGLIQSDCLAISTSTFLFQSVPQRWHISTVLCLNDPNLQLNLHNFAVTIPVPNEYVSAAERLTAFDYSQRNFGLGVKIEEAIKHNYDLESTSLQEFLSGYANYRVLKSAALVLAGLYKKYVDGLE